MNYKTIILGKAGVGKTSLATRIYKNIYNEYKGSTIGFIYSNFKISDKILDFWDTSGQERYNSLAPLYYRNSIIVLIVYDTHMIDSIDIAEKWIRQIKNDEPNARIILIGNKIDMETKINYDKLNLLKKYVHKYIDVSAKNNIGIETLKKLIVSEIIKYNDDMKQKNELVDLTEPHIIFDTECVTKKSCC